jgi:hypothetical protein
MAAEFGRSAAQVSREGVVRFVDNIENRESIFPSQSMDIAK